MKSRRQTDIRHTFTLGIKTLAYVLSVLMILYAVPTIIYADLIETVEGALADDTVVASTGETETAVNQEIFEAVERREETVKHFRMPDGSFVAVQYDLPVHELDAQGDWQDIDNTLSAEGSEYSTSNARVKFAKKITGNETLFTLHEGNHKITMSLVGARKKVQGQVTNTQTEFGAEATQLQKMMTLDKLSSRILYADILDGVDLEYVVESRNIKENIIVKEKADEYAFSFEMKLNNAAATLCENGDITITDPNTAEIIYTIPKGFMYDAAGAFSDAVSYLLTGQGNGTYTLTVVADADWINEEGRAFPITVDPPLNSGCTTANTIDTYVDSDNPASTYYSFSFMAVGHGSSQQEFISYWKMNTLPTIPANAYVVKADFSLYCQEFRNHGAYTTPKLQAGLYQVTSDWTGEATWNAVTNSTLGDMKDYCNISPEQQGTYVSWDITSLYNLWIETPLENHGIALQQVNSMQVDSLFTSTAGTANRPRFTVNYRDMKGIESYWSGSSHSAGLAGSGFVNHATGNLVFSIGTLSTGDNLFGYTPSLVYNSAIGGEYHTFSDNANVHYKYASVGYGMKLSTNESIVSRTYADENGVNQTYYVCSDSDGTEHYFLYDASSATYKDEDGLGLTLTMDTDHYYIDDQNHTRRRFTRSTGTGDIYAGGILEHIQDRYGNKLRFNYNSKGQTTNIDLLPTGHDETKAIRYLTMSYNSLNILYQIKNEMTGQVVQLEYGTSFAGTTDASTSNNGPLKRMKYGHMSGTTVVVDAVMVYSYTDTATGGVYRLASAKDETAGVEIRYTYYTSGRVATVTEYGSGSKGQSISLTYGTDYTEIRSSGSDDIINTTDDIITRYSIDSQGRHVGAYSTNSAGTTLYGATNQVFDTQGGTDSDSDKNKIKASAIVNGVGVNYIFNGSFQVGNTGSNGWTFSHSDMSIEKNMDQLKPQYLNVPVPTSASRKVYQYVSLPKGTYTLSATCEGDGISGDVSVKLIAESLTSSANSFVKEWSLSINPSTQPALVPSLTFASASNNEKFKITIEIVGGSSVSGSVHIDNVMLENNVGASTYNAVQYGGFDETTVNSSGSTVTSVSLHWTKNSGKAAFGTSGGMRGDALKIEGDVASEQSVYQNIPINTSNSNDGMGISTLTKPRTFTISGFAKGSGQVANEEAVFALQAEVSYYNVSGTDTFRFDFNRELTGWQFASGSFTIDEYRKIKTIKVSCVYAYQPGTAYFDNISLVEETGSETAGYFYNDDGLLEFMYSPARSEYYTYSGTNLTAVYDSDGFGTRYTYNSQNAVISQTEFRYTGSDLVTWYLYPNEDGSRPSWSPSVTSLYRAEYSVDPYGMTTATLTYSLSNTTSNRLSTSTTYNTTAGSYLFGKILSQTDAAGNVTRYTYVMGRLIYEYQGNGGLYYTYDALGRMTAVYPLNIPGYDENSLAEKAIYSYNSKLQLQKIKTDTTTYTFNYNSFGNISSIYVGSDAGTGSTALVNYQYKSYNGKLSSVRYENGRQMSYTYDELDRVKEICYNDSTGTPQKYVYTYTASGQVHTVECTESGRIYNYYYDSKGQVIAYTEQGTSNALGGEYWYDEMGRLSSYYLTLSQTVGSAVQLAGMGCNYDYDLNGNLLGLKIYSADSDVELDLSYGYDSLYRPLSKSMTDGTGFTLTTGYAYQNVTTTQTSPLIDTYTTSVNGVSTAVNSYEYDSRGNIIKVTDRLGRLITYTYDDLDQLIREDNQPLGKTYVYTYDNAGNRTSKTVYAYTPKGTSVAGLTYTSTESYSYASSGWGDRLTSDGSNTYTYDAVGNPLNYNGYILEWNGRQLVSMSGGPIVEINYEYNDEGIRTKKDIDGEVHTYTLEGSRIVSESWDNILIVYLYDENGSPIGMQYRTTSMAENTFYTFYFEKNLQGDIVAVYNESGTKIVTYTYDAWGNFTTTYYSTVGTNLYAVYNPFRYRGYYYDTEIGLYYLQSRYYNPQWGRFLNADGYVSTGTGFSGNNMYAYCNNNPVIRIDCNGQFWDYVLDVCFLVWSIADVFNDPSDWKNWTALGIDIVFAVVPFVPSGGGQVVKVGNKIENTMDIANAINKVDNIQDAAKVTMIGRKMDRVTETARLVGIADNLYDVWKGYDKTAKGAKKFFHNGISMLHDGGWLFGKLRKGYTVIDIGVTTAHKGLKGFGLWYGTERFVLGLWETRNVWKLPINYYW